MRSEDRKMYTIKMRKLMLIFIRSFFKKVFIAFKREQQKMFYTTTTVLIIYLSYFL